MIPGNLIRLWPLERHDLLKNYQWANDRQLIRLAGMSPLPKSVWEIERWYESVAQNPEVQVYSIKTAEGDYIGNIELLHLDSRSGHAEIGLLIGERGYWGKGYGSDAVDTLCRFAFQELRLHRLYARVLEYNERARRTFEKLGFRLEGTERETYYHQGRYWDASVLGLLDREYRGLEGPAAGSEETPAPTLP
ncbi:MAG TPA: GNAT family protein [Candidatus Nitrosotenuis sp.]|nr:GNAT family protein [Candidatus Nitrosotenuis sp.]